MAAEIVWLEEQLNWERWLRRQRQTLEQLRTPLPVAAPFDHHPEDQPLLLWSPTPRRSGVVLNWPKAPR